jgi:hypothetical protein
MRQPGWEFRLVAYANSQVGRPFVWGETDCYSLVREALECVYDADLLPHIIYTSKAKATTAARAFPQPGAALSDFGAVRVPLPNAQSGDVLLMPGDDGLGLPRFAVVVDGRGRVLTSDPGAGAEVLRASNIPPDSTAWRWDV